MPTKAGQYRHRQLNPAFTSASGKAARPRKSLRLAPLLAAMLLACGLPLRAQSVAALGSPAKVQDSTTLSFSVPAGNNRLLAVAVSGDNAQNFTGVTFNSQPLTKGVLQNDGSAAVDSIWYLPLGSSASATASTITVNGNPDFVGAQAFQNVDQTAPVSSPQSAGIGSGDDISSSLTFASPAGDLVFDVVDIYDSDNNGIETPGGSQTLVHYLPIKARNAFYSTSTRPGAGSSTVSSWTTSGEALIQAGINIHAAPAAAPATVVSVSTTRADGAYGTGVVIPIAVTFSAPVNVTGTPTLTLDSGGTAAYAGGSGGTNLTFNYTVASGQTAAALDYSFTNSLALAGGTIQDAGASNAVLILPVPGNSGSIESGKTITIDTMAPAITLSATFTALHGPVTFAVTYADTNFSHTTLTTSDITLNATGSATGTLSVTGGAGSATGTNCIVTISNISGSGTLGISIAAGTAVDRAGNTAPAAGPSFPFVVDRWQFVSLYAFTNGVDGNSPQGGLTLAGDGNYYGVTLDGGDGDSGTIFSVNTNGLVSIVYTFTGLADGGTPHAGLLLASDGFLYGTTTTGGTNGYNNGTVFRLSTNGDFSVIYTFTGSGFTDGSDVVAPLIQGTDGNLYGIASSGGENFLGVAFQITTNGDLTPLYSFTGGPDGDEPMAPLFQASDGNLYGTCQYGGTNNQGTVFQMTTGGALTPLYSFTAAPNLTNDDGTQPLGGLVQTADGNLYSITSAGGPDNGGTVFRITTNGQFSVIHALDINTEGYGSAAALMPGSDGQLYGSTQFGGLAGNGSIFRVTTDGVLTTLYSFVGGNFGDGAGMIAPLLQGADGNVYGAASQGNTGSQDGAGAIFELLNPNPPPFITSVLTADGVYGGNFSYAITASRSPSGFNAAGLPAGLTVDTGSGVISGVPATNGIFAVTLSATNSGGAATATLSLTIATADATVTLDDLNQTYDGTAKSIAPATVPPGLAVTVTYDGLADAPVNAGSYTVIGTVNDANYIGAVTNTLVVSNAVLIVTANNQFCYVGQTNPVFTGTMSGAVAGDDLSVSYSTTATAASPAGGYDIVPALNDPESRLGNYDVTLIDGQLTVASGQPAITLVTNTLFYTLNQAPVLFSAGATLAAPDSPTFAGGHLTVAIATNVEPSDLLFVQNAGTGAGQIGAAAGSVTYGGLPIAAYSGGTTGAVALQFTFNANADATGIQELLRNLTFEIVGTDATNLTRALALTFDDGNSLTSAPVALTLLLNHQPTALPYHVATGTNLPIAISFARLLTNSADIDADPVSIIQVDAASLNGGVVSSNETGIVYTPAAGYSGVDQFFYTIGDDRTGTNVGAVYVTVLIQESLAVEDPLQNPGSFPQTITLGITGISGRTYRVLASEDFISWTPVGTVTEPEGGFVNFLDNNDHPYRFYRTVYP